MSGMLEFFTTLLFGAGVAIFQFREVLLLVNKQTELWWGTLAGLVALIVINWFLGSLWFVVLMIVKKIKRGKGSAKIKMLEVVWFFVFWMMWSLLVEKVALFSYDNRLLAYILSVLVVSAVAGITILMIALAWRFLKQRRLIGKIILTSGYLLVFLVVLVSLTVGLKKTKRIGREIRKTDKPNVVLITSDALRADRFNKEFMPQTWGWFEKQGIIFEKAYSPAPWTIPSFASMLTNKYPMQVGADIGLEESEKKYFYGGVLGTDPSLVPQEEYRSGEKFSARYAHVWLGSEIAEILGKKGKVAELNLRRTVIEDSERILNSLI